MYSSHSHRIAMFIDALSMIINLLHIQIYDMKITQLLVGAIHVCAYVQSNYI